MKDNRLWLVAWAAVSALWVMYWIGMTMALGVEGIHELIAGLGWPLLVGALYLTVPAFLYLAGSMLSCIATAGKRDKNKA